MQLFKKLCLTISIFIAMMPELAGYNHRASKKTQAPGIIVVCNGTSSAGKTTLVKALQEMYHNDWLVEAIDEYAKTHQHNGFANLRYHGFYKMIHQKALDGHNILVDTVLYHAKYKKYDKMLQADGVQLIKILVYCPIDCLVAHVQKRNQSGDAMEHRTVSQAFRAFLSLYTMQTQDHKNIIDTMHSKQMKAALQKSLDVIAKWPAKSKQRQKVTNKKMVHQFNLNTPHQIAISPIHQWDLIVNTSIDSPKDIAQKIVEFIKKRNHFFGKK